MNPKRFGAHNPFVSFYIHPTEANESQPLAPSSKAFLLHFFFSTPGKEKHYIPCAQGPTQSNIPFQSHPNHK